VDKEKPAGGFNLRAFPALASLGTLGALTINLTAEAALSNLPEAQIAAAGGMGALRAALLLQPIILVLVASGLGLALAHKVRLRSWIVTRFRGQPHRTDAALQAELHLHQLQVRFRLPLH
jgi:hypothetical protein